MLGLAILVFVLQQYASAQNPSCDYQQYLQPSQTAYAYSPNYPNYYTGDQSCRWIATTQPGYTIKLECPEIDLPSSPSCQTDRLLVSVTGDPLLTAAQHYCGKGTLNLQSNAEKLSIGLLAQKSTGGRFYCRVTSVPGTTTPDCRCGYSKTNRIVGGQETGVNAYPFMTAVVDKRTIEVKCGGAIIDKRWILTAAHCLYRQSEGNFAIVVGEHDITTGQDTSATKAYAIKRFIIHPQFNPQNFDYDVGLVELTQDIEYSDRVGPVCLPYKYRQESFASERVTALGWGTEFIGGPKSNVLQEVDLDVITQDSCRASEPSVTYRQICTYTPAKDACQDDSGGPLLYKDRTNGLLYSVGIISYGQLCATLRPGSNTRVTQMLDWIDSTTRVNFCKK